MFQDQEEKPTNCFLTKTLPFIFHLICAIPTTLLLIFLVYYFNNAYAPSNTLGVILFLLFVVIAALLLASIGFSIFNFIKTQSRCSFRPLIIFYSALLVGLLIFICVVAICLKADLYKEAYKADLDRVNEGNGALNVSDWLDELQANMKCCQYDSEVIYPFSEPTSCCNMSQPEKNLKNCLTHYSERDKLVDYYNYVTTCSVPVNVFVNDMRKKFFLACAFGIISAVIAIVYWIIILVKVMPCAKKACTGKSDILLSEQNKIA